MTEAPVGLAPGGRVLWRAVAGLHELDRPQLATLEQACRQRDRCDVLAPEAVAGNPGTLRHERDAALAMTGLLAALRLPDAAGRKPQARPIRGVQAPSVPMSALERGRLLHAGK